MIAIFDAFYRKDKTITSCVCISSWESVSSALEIVDESAIAHDYISGELFKREMPGIISILERLKAQVIPSFIIIDGYVWLEVGRPGLGHHLFLASGGQTPVIGVAKNPFKGSPHSTLAFRGESRKPLYVTSIGISQSTSAEMICKMAGSYRLPAMIKRADILSKQIAHA